MKRKKLILGTLAIIVGICLLLSIPIFFLQSNMNKTTLLHNFNQQATAPSPKKETQKQPEKNNSQEGVTGKLILPSLSLEVPIVEGTDQTVLKKGAGHLSTSVQPGKNGTSVIAAHNVTFFHNIGELKPNDTIQVETKSGTQTFQVYQTKVVKTGDPIYETVTPSMVLETCYPFNAINSTPYRYLVFASLKP